MDELDLLDDVCDRCRHTLDGEGVCPSCGWVRPRAEGPLPPYDPHLGDDLPSVHA